MLSEEKLRVGIYGGTFAPPHIGHQQAARAFMEQMKLDYMYVIPAFLPPHKQVDASDDPMHRLRMCERAFGGMEGVIVSDMEIRRGGKSFTVNTLEQLWGEDRKLFLLLGTDMVLTLDRWYRFEDILKLCYPVYVRRENDVVLGNRVVAKLSEYYEKYGVMIRRIVTEPIDLSSTRIRQACAANENISHMVCPEVAQYIKENGLYV